MTIRYRFQSVKTKFFAISRSSDKDDQEVDTQPPPGAPNDTVRAQRSTLAWHSLIFGQVLFINRPLGPGPNVVEITGVSGLSVSLKVNIKLP